MRINFIPFSLLFVFACGRESSQSINPVALKADVTNRPILKLLLPGDFSLTGTSNKLLFSEGLYDLVEDPGNPGNCTASANNNFTDSTVEIPAISGDNCLIEITQLTLKDAEINQDVIFTKKDPAVSNSPAGENHRVLYEVVGQEASYALTLETRRYLSVPIANNDSVEFTVFFGKNGSIVNNNDNKVYNTINGHQSLFDTTFVSPYDSESSEISLENNCFEELSNIDGDFYCNTLNVTSFENASVSSVPLDEITQGNWADEDGSDRYADLTALTILDVSTLHSLSSNLKYLSRLEKSTVDQVHSSFTATLKSKYLKEDNIARYHLILIKTFDNGIPSYYYTVVWVE